VGYLPRQGVSQHDIWDAKSIELTSHRIVTPTIIEAESFRTWQNEAFMIWREWQKLYPSRSQSGRFLRDLREDVWLVNVVGHEYRDANSLWRILDDMP